jgi:hypothetical protein
MRVCIPRNLEDNKFHCVCGLKFATAEAVQRHGRENQNPDHPKDFFTSFTAVMNRRQKIPS